MVKSNTKFVYYGMKVMVILFPLLATLILGCSLSNSKPLLIDFTNDSSQVKLTNIDEAGIWQLKNLQKSRDALDGLVAVLQMPSDQDTTLREQPVPGKLQFVGQTLIFQPDQPFLRGQEYLVITHLNTSFGHFGDILQGDLNTRVKPIQKVLRR